MNKYPHINIEATLQNQINKIVEETLESKGFEENKNCLVDWNAAVNKDKTTIMITVKPFDRIEDIDITVEID